jgi:hypothetical protein
MIHLLLVVLGFATPAHAADSSCPKLNRTILIDVGDCTRPGMRLPKVLSNPQRALVYEEKDLRTSGEARRFAENRYKSEEGVLATRYCNLGKQLVRNGITAPCQGGVIGRHGRKSVFNPSDPFSGDAR